MAHTSPETLDEAAAARIHHVIQLLNRAVFDAMVLDLVVSVDEVPPSQNPKAATSPQFVATVKRIENL